MPPLPFESAHFLFLPAGMEHQIALTPLPHRSLISTLRLQLMCGLQSSANPLKAFAMVRLLSTSCGQGVQALPACGIGDVPTSVSTETLLMQDCSGCPVWGKNPCYWASKIPKAMLVRFIHIRSLLFLNEWALNSGSHAWALSTTEWAISSAPVSSCKLPEDFTFPGSKTEIEGS